MYTRLLLLLLFQLQLLTNFGRTCLWPTDATRGIHSFKKWAYQGWQL